MAFFIIFIRSTLFNVFSFLYSFVFSVIGIFVLFLPQKFIAKYSLWWVRVILIALENIAGLNYHVIGASNIPKEGVFIIASKHQSMMETLLMTRIFRYSIPILKSELLKIPLWGWIIKGYGAIGINRKSKVSAMRSLSKQLNDYKGRNFFIFPEGTRSSVGKSGDYQSGVYMIYRSLKCPVVPVALNTGVFWPKRGWLKYPGTATVKILKPIQPGLPKEQFMDTLKDMIEAESNSL